MRTDKTIEAFFSLVSGGLWEREVSLSQFGDVDYNEVLILAEEQSVVGLVAAGLEHVTDTVVPKEVVLQFIGQAIKIEQRNSAMNHFVAEIVEKMRNAGIYTLLVKGQGIAQCYERPLWRACGDIDLLLDRNNYERAISFLAPLSESAVDNSKDTKHYSLDIGLWEVELHGTLRTQIRKRIDRIIDDIQENILSNTLKRVWKYNNTDIYLPTLNSDVVFIFTHILQHFFRGGIGLRQLCDLGRLLWSYRDSIDKNLLYQHLIAMDLITEWKVFGLVIVDELGLPSTEMPFYDNSTKLLKKRKNVISYILTVGNFGHNKDISYQYSSPVIIRKIRTFLRQTKDSANLMAIFPKNATISLFNYLWIGIKGILGKN